ncbi:hypothetical protein AtNW77_Chr1g0041131 [Arabidopsis thaliana]|uniref:Uncharacterized protein n=3 Tax=Arabidopsis TaxID=3701 RepID=F4I394_ARATH|nr:uncharacterized protein AT1G36920 [Arabidopsis thaliana]NP_001321140.1 uncharacterized protein AT1G36920 [Arabidopsis thaliana]NP_174885.2 uncharacterized protein AT1G36920 [Arabidopsis thaliana]KAG7648604.1 hypothetical protein ISN45_At01g036040 [Arabidopsis thaliana x Arabidopsis arenosa]AEE31875.1 hypothetical protein AT1G36920 [Arabidopsis thaliana]ANM58724.1 hypothetical protein AT1G36920 [Arabidopsis thaliana]ANM58725.1 hypothetical protein AT1G36920 [Arabidopsis thaliana]OAP12959.1|eukprot:NP_001319155.1 hypothetical protein AT1G36920 [Arabidopsis thaliana]
MKLRVSLLLKVQQSCLIFSLKILGIHLLMLPYGVNLQKMSTLILNLNHQVPFFLLGSLMKTLLYQGKGTVQSSKFTTKAYIHSPLPEILRFQEALCNEEPRLAITEIKSSKSAHISKQSFHLSERKTIIELMETNQVMTCNILASISLEPKASWFYIGCTLCFTKAKQYFNPKTEEI